MNIKEYNQLSDGEKQNKVGDFVNREVIYCITPLMEDIIIHSQLLENDIIESMDNFTTNEYDEYPEIYEYWLVSDWLLDQLEKKGEVIMRDYHGLNVWCRQTTGQAILLDSVIEDIYIDTFYWTA